MPFALQPLDNETHSPEQVINASVNFETRYSTGNVPHGDLVANNLFVQPTVHHQDGAIPEHSTADTDHFVNNAYALKEQFNISIVVIHNGNELDSSVGADTGQMRVGSFATVVRHTHIIFTHLPIQIVGILVYPVGSDPPIDAKSWSTNCTTSFAAWAAGFPASVVAGLSLSRALAVAFALALSLL